MKKIDIYHKNYIYLILEGIFFDVGFVFFDPTTILPLLIERLTGSTFLVGLLAMVRYLGAGIASLLAGNWNRTLKYKKNFLIKYSAITRLPIWLLGLYLLFYHNGNVILVGLFIIFIQSLFWVGDGALSTAWVDVVGKTINPYQRGKFFSIRQISSGIIAVFAGFVIKHILSLKFLIFPTNYGLIIMISAALYTLSLLMFFGLEEKASNIVEKESIKDLIKNMFFYFKKNRNFSKSMAVLGFSMLSSIALPFYIVYAKTNFNILDSTVGIFIIVQTLGKILGGLIYGVIGDKYGHHKSMLIYSISTTTAPIIAIITGFFFEEHIIILYSLLYFLLGFFINGWPIFFNYMIDSVEKEDRSLYAGLVNVVKIPASLAPLAGGIIVSFFGYLPIFYLALIFSIMGLMFALKLDDARIKNDYS
ncbi:MAG TPA: MFS transporter [Halanaerobiales bacterium]|nr:MFS transporter [Halanaerobiales bacterium]